ncbi:serine/threonine protein kinase [Hyalangium sp.]|uniref:serine/threonine protein kinase n=1 Tax=Hyalangium sp. TaxID=2028555 RepID=UPI002D6E88DE|nr:protein kinase [Hyalangium sp.]HYH97124.1 protein kinase [Hyalangium sp.]
MQTGKYELISRLAVGGMAEVFLASATGPMGFEKRMVLKRILPHLAEDPAFVEMFLREAKLVAQLNHPNIVQIFDFGEADGSYFLTMEYIDGPNLRVLRKKARALGMPLPPALCARLVASACEGLAFAHDFQDPDTGKPLGLIHRDISTDNILVSRQGAVKVVDFGIAKTADQSHKTQNGVLKGKVPYMSPEQIRARPLDRRVDVYSLGVVLYELLTGRKPFNSPTDASLMQAILFEPLPPAVMHRPDLPEALQHILERALAKDREHRYPDCRAFQLELEDFILSTGKSVGAYQLSQLVTQLVASGDTAASPAKGTGESQATAASRTPASSAGSRAPKSSSRTVELKTPRPQPTADDTLPMKPAERKVSDPVPPQPVEAASQEVQTQSTHSKPPLMWIAALGGAALLIAGGGYLAGASTGQEAPVVKDSREPPAPSITLAPHETPMPPSIEPIVEPPTQLTHETKAEQAPPTERIVDRKSSAPTSRAPVARAHRESKQAATARTGTLHLVVRGWADIWVDGKKKGRVPPINELELPPGRHELKLVNPALKPYRALVTITAGETLEHRVVFQAAGPATEDSQAKAPGDAEATQVASGAR